MKFSKLTLAIATTIGASASFSAFAIDLYVDTKTKQIYAEPGRGRVLMGAFERVEDKPVATPAEATEIADVRQDLEMKTNEIKALQEHMEEAEKVKVKVDKKGLQVESADKNFKFNLGGRIQTDANYSVNGNYVEAGTAGTADPISVDANDGTEVRRGRIDFTGTFYKDWNFKTQVDFADNAVAVKDLFVQYTGLDFMSVTGGQQKQNFSQELLESSNDLMFTERSLMNVLNAPVVDRAIGLNLQTPENQKNWSAALGFYGDTINANKNNGKADEGWSVSGRGTYAPIEEKTKVVHLGIAGNYRQPNANDQVMDKGLVYEYETDHMSNLFLIESDVENINNISMLGLEAKGLFGPFSGGAEYTHTWLSRGNGDNNLNFDGWYVDAAWSITGESRKYKQGKFYKLSPAKEFSFKNGTWGAFELASRYSGVDLNDGSFHGGRMHNFTTALNWYFNDNVRLMADWTRAFDVSYSPVTTTGGGAPNDNNTFTVRAQLAY
ncbi:MAG: OprO/OprP family phosphate-selective porin [Methylococcaceae bacterium]